MTSSQTYRDFLDWFALRYPGRIDPMLFQDCVDVGDGYPGLQRIFKNWVREYLHDGVMERDLDVNHNINMNNNSINDVNSIDGGGNAVVFDDDIQMNASHIDLNGNDLDNIDNIDENIFYCSTEAEINAAISAIGANGGTIILESGTINLTGTININGGGSYIIKGQGVNSVIDCNADRTAINITSADSCVLKDFKIDSGDLITTAKEIIDVTEVINNPVVCDNITISGNGSGYGIELNSENVIIRNCDISEVFYGIIIQTDNNHAINNYIHGSSLVPSAGIVVNTADNLRIIGNYITGITGRGILLQGADNCVVNGNICISNDVNYAGHVGVIEVSDSDYNVITGNVCNNNNNAGVGNSIGIYIAAANCDKNVVTGNVALGNDNNFGNAGTNTLYQTATDGDPLNIFV